MNTSNNTGRFVVTVKWDAYVKDCVGFPAGDLTLRTDDPSEKWFAAQTDFLKIHGITPRIGACVDTLGPTGIEAAVCADIARRQALGIAKYGQTVADNPLTLKQWLQHAYEETLDNAVYLKRAIAEIESQEVSPGLTPGLSPNITSDRNTTQP